MQPNHMTRRQMIQLAAMAMAATAPQAWGAPRGRAASVKKGLGITTGGVDWSQKLTELRCAWFYSWGARAPSGIPAGTTFTPMIWGNPGKGANLAGIGAAAKAAGCKDLLGFNEPDQTTQGNLSVEQALEAWPLLMETGLRLGSPACVHPDNAWMKAFMAGAKKKQLRVDFVCVHSYGSADPDAFVKRLESIHKLYRKPIWITEFAVGDWQAKSAEENRYKPRDVLRFMESILRDLGRMDFVERYAWFSAKPSSNALGTSSLYDAAGKLNRLGECYRDA